MNFRSLPLAFCALALACEPPDDTGGVDCDLMAYASVSVSVRADDGSVPAELVVQYALDGADPVPCDALETGEFACGWEQSGHFVITAQAEGFEDGVLQVDVAADECHVIQEAATIELSAIGCTQEVVPAVVATVIDVQGAAVEDADVSWAFVGDDMPEEYCDSASNVYVCAEEQHGSFDITVRAEGYITEDQVVQVGFDGCHPITEEIEVVLGFAPD